MTLGARKFVPSALACLAALISYSGKSSGGGFENPVVIYVAPENLEKSNASLITQSSSALTKARDTLRSLRSSGKLKKRSVIVVFKAGEYMLSETFMLDERDSGEPGYPVIFQPERGAKVQITGAVNLTGWRTGEDGEVYADWPSDCPRYLYINAKRRPRPRLPAEGWFSIGAVDSRGKTGEPVSDHFTVSVGDLPPKFKNSPETEILIIDSWTSSRLRILQYDPISRRLDLRGVFAGHGVHRDLTAGLPYIIENAPTQQLNPGTWQCDSVRSIIRYRLLPGESAPKLNAIVPRLQQLIRIEGTADKAVHDITWRGIHFAYTDWSLSPDGWAAMQAEVGLPAAIDVSHARDILLNDVKLEHAGAAGLRIGLDSAGITLSDSTMRDIGGGGVLIGSDQRIPRPNSNWTGGNIGQHETHNITIERNAFSHLGQVHPAAVGVWSGQAHHINILNNRISDLFYTGISLGWVWNSGPSLSHNNLVIGNIISRFGNNVMSDFGGIYTLGQMPGTVISGNRILHGHARTYGGHGLYADQGSGGIRFSKNFVSDTSHAPVQVTQGSALLFQKNTFKEFGEAAIYCNLPSFEESVEFLDNDARTNTLVPPTLGFCGDKSYRFSNLRYSNPVQNRSISKPFGESRANLEFVPDTEEIDNTNKTVRALEIDKRPR